MELFRNNSDAITDEKKVLSLYGVKEEEFIANGTEARVYRLGSEQVLKMYANTPGAVEKITLLKEFYEDLDSSALSFETPSILEYRSVGEIIGMVEKRIPGEPLIPKQLSFIDDITLAQYFNVGKELRQLFLKKDMGRYLLLDPQHLSASSEGDWHYFMKKLLQARLSASPRSLLGEQRKDIESLTAQLFQWYETPYKRPLGVVHGDLFPGNILVNDEGKVTGVVDFGTFTMQGDSLFDLATMAGFYCMYGEEVKKVRDRLLTFSLQECSSEEQALIHRYLITYALLSADLYPEKGGEPSASGHYKWALEIVRDKEYWKSAL